MSKNIIYTAYDYAASDIPPFLYLHIFLIKEYTKKINCDLKIIDKPCNYINKSFIKQDVYNHFLASTYDYMLWVDTDVLISLDAPDIFSHYSDTDIAARHLPQSGKMNTSDLKNFTRFINIAKNKINGPDICIDSMYNPYFSAGVMLYSRKGIEAIMLGDINYIKIYNDILPSTKIKAYMSEKQLDNPGYGYVRDEFITNYVAHQKSSRVIDIGETWCKLYGTYNNTSDRFHTSSHFNHFDVNPVKKNRYIKDYLLCSS